MPWRAASLIRCRRVPAAICCVRSCTTGTTGQHARSCGAARKRQGPTAGSSWWRSSSPTPTTAPKWTCGCSPTSAAANAASPSSPPSPQLRGSGSRGASRGGDTGRRTDRSVTAPGAPTAVVGAPGSSGRDPLRMPAGGDDSNIASDLPLSTTVSAGPRTPRSTAGVLAGATCDQPGRKRVASAVGEGATTVQLVHEYLEQLEGQPTRPRGKETNDHPDDPTASVGSHLHRRGTQLEQANPTCSSRSTPSIRLVIGGSPV